MLRTLKSKRCGSSTISSRRRGVLTLKSDELVTINQGKERAGHRAVIAAGTGLGVAGLFWDGKQHHPFPSEGGHADFAPRDEIEKLLWVY